MMGENQNKASVAPQPGAADRRAALSDELSDLYRATPLAMALFTPDHRAARINALHARMFDLDAETAVGRPVEEISPRTAGDLGAYIDKVVETGEPQQWVRTRAAAHEGGEPRTLNTHWYPIFDSDGSVRAVGAITEDISEIEKREIVLKQIARELQHRVKNTLANVIALVEQAERSAENRPDALSTLKRRVLALSLTHSNLTESNWGPTSLKDIIEQEMTRVYGTESIRLTGPDILIMAQSALAFSMGLHEMTANAASYGALSQRGGHVEMSWRVERGGDEGGWIHFDWKERGGPAIGEAEPSGFGHRLIDASLRTSLRGKMERLWEADGLHYRFSLPLSLVTGGQ